MPKIQEVVNRKLAIKAVPVKEIPKAKKLVKVAEYDTVFNQIIESPEKMFLVTAEGKTAKSLYRPFSLRVRAHNRDPKRKFNAALKVRNRQIYIVKSEKEA
jgi:hypothetical protein